MTQVENSGAASDMPKVSPKEFGEDQKRIQALHVRLLERAGGKGILSGVAIGSEIRSYVDETGMTKAQRDVYPSKIMAQLPWLKKIEGTKRRQYRVFKHPLRPSRVRAAANEAAPKGPEAGRASDTELLEGLIARVQTSIDIKTRRAHLQAGLDEVNAMIDPLFARQRAISAELEELAPPLEEGPTPEEVLVVLKKLRSS